MSGDIVDRLSEAGQIEAADEITKLRKAVLSMYCAAMFGDIGEARRVARRHWPALSAPRRGGPLITQDLRRLAK